MIISSEALRLVNARTAVLMFVALLLMSSTLISAQAQKLVDFEIPDQFERVHRRSDVQGSIVLLIGADRAGSAFTGKWGIAIREALGEHPRYGEVRHLSLADMRGVPFFLKGMIRGKFPQEKERWVMLDWKGVLPKAYGFASKSANILVFAPDGSLAHQVSGQEPDDGILDGIVDALRSLLDATR